VVDRYDSPPLELPGRNEPFERADLVFYDVDHSGLSFEARIFLDAPKTKHKAGRDHPNYVGSFFIFGHGECFGDLGHCDVPRERDPFDLRPPHQLLPAIRIVTVTDSIRELVTAGIDNVVVTVVAHTPGDASNKVLAFDKIRLATYA
jgi:hypothetical protein